MARHEQSREDLLAEATALVQRAELAVAGLAEHVVIGFRRDGCGSVYFGQDSAWHFNTRLQLRRAFLSGVLYKAERRRLVSLERQRTADEVQLMSDDLGDQRQQEILSQLGDSLAALRARLAAGELQIVGQVPPDEAIIPRIVRWLDALPRPLELAASPHAR